MEDLRLEALAPFVVAWHNRHPLAHRIAVEQVQSVGYVLLPFEQPGVPPDPPLVTLTDEVQLGGTGLDAGTALDPGAAAASLRNLAAARASGQGQPGATAQTGAGPALPFAPPPKGLAPAFSEPFFEHTTARRVARWAQRHGAMWAGPGLGLGPSDTADGADRGDIADVDLAKTFSGAQVRQVVVDPALWSGAGGPRGRRVHLVLRTACIEVGGDRLRLLLGTGASPQVLGPRCLSQRRAFAVLALGLGAGGTAMGLWLSPSGETTPVLAMAPAQAAAPVAAPASAPGPLLPFTVPSTVPPAFAPASAAASAPVSAATPASAAAPAAAASAAPSLAHAEQPARPASAALPPDAQPQLGKVFLPPLSPFFEEPRVAAARAKKQAEQAERAARQAAPGASAVGGTAVAPAPLMLAPVAPTLLLLPPPPVAPTGLVFALSTRLLRTTAESEQLSSAMRTVLVAQGARDLRVEVLPVGDDWRVVGWPFANRELANKSRDLLMARGLKVEVVAF